MNADPDNEKYTGQKPTNEVFGDQLEGGFISNKTIYRNKQ